jgi:hypothetical protein
MIASENEAAESVFEDSSDVCLLHLPSREGLVGDQGSLSMRDEDTQQVKYTDSAVGTSHATPAAPVSKPVLKPLPPETEELVRTVCLDVLDKQYKLYSWNDTKTQALITTNSVMFAAVGFLFKECLRDTLAMVLLGTAILFLGASLITCLIQVIPRISSGKSGEDPNTRSLRGITSFEKWQDYHNAFVASSKSNVTTDTIRQVFGMAQNNIRSARIVRGGVILTICGLTTVFGAVFSSAIAARGHHAFGSWQIETIAGSANPSSLQNTTESTPSRVQQPAPSADNSTVPSQTTPRLRASSPRSSNKKQP